MNNNKNIECSEIIGLHPIYRFTVIEDQIKARFKRVIPLHEKIDLNLKANIENLREIIKAYEDPTGEKYIQIKTEEGYKVFK